MAAATGVVLVKKFTYRGDNNEEWSNKYWLTGTPPLDPASWKLLYDQLIADETFCYSSTTHVVRAYGYNDNTPGAASVDSHDYALTSAEIPGQLPNDLTGHVMAGDQAGIVWWLLQRRSANGKPVYLRKYFHDGFVGAARDDIGTTCATQYNNFATRLLSGSGSTGRKIRSQKQDEVLVSGGHDPFITTRTLKRRGKRPLP